MALTAEQKIRNQIAENAWRFQHEGTRVLRWLTGGTAPDAYATFEPQGDKVIARCPSCGEFFGRFDANYGRAARRQIAALREVGAHHHCCGCFGETAVSPNGKGVGSLSCFSIQRPSIRLLRFQ